MGWNAAQKKAIEVRDKNIIVSAGAGSSCRSFRRGTVRMQRRAAVFQNRFPDLF